MKKSLRSMLLLASMFIGCSLFSQRMETGKIDVSNAAPTRFDVHNTTEAEREAINKEYHALLLKQNPKYDMMRNEFEKQVQQYIADHPNLNQQKAVVTVPVVVHVVWNSTNPAGNISLAQVQSQITVLNQDYGRTNPDASQTPAPWVSVAANTNIQFCLAQRKPDNVTPTNGVEYRQNNAVTSWSSNNAVKFFASGGLDAWDPTRYMNIWVCDLGSSLLGYGEFPTSSVSNTFGVVIKNSAFGNVGSATAPPYNLGRTTTHEFSHCFNLYHIWGDDGTACTGTDNCADTPNQAGSTLTCFAFPHLDGCSSSPAPNAGDPVNGIMFMNYMDYSDDNCMNMFTQNQSARQNTILNMTPYNVLTTSNGCTPLVLMSNDAGISAVTKPNGNVCSTTFQPIVVLKNFGGNALTTCTIKSKIDNGTPVTFNWTGNIASTAFASVTLPSVTTTGGAHTFKAWTFQPNGLTDPQPSNDSTTSAFTVIGAGAPLPFSEGFEGTTFVPAGWTLNNPDGARTWARTTAAAKTGVASAFMDNFFYNTGIGQKDDMVTKAIDLTSTSGPVLTFQEAYVYYTQTTPTPATNTDTLTVSISTDCGSTWSVLYKKGGAQLATATPVPNINTNFTPTAAQWRLENVSLSAYSMFNNVMLMFRNTSGYGDDLYLDDINIASFTGIGQAQLNAAVNVYPNPSEGQIFLKLNLPVSENFEVRIVDMLGRSVASMKQLNSIGGNFNFDLSNNSNGFYFVQVITDQGTVTRKVMLDKQ